MNVSFQATISVAVLSPHENGRTKRKESSKTLIRFDTAHSRRKQTEICPPVLLF